MFVFGILTIIFGFIYIIFAGWWMAEFFIGKLLSPGAAPQVPSGRKLREAVVAEINENFPDAKTIIDIGSCYGGLARKIAKARPGAKVVAVERMLLAALISKSADRILRSESKTLWADAFGYMEKSEGFDVGVAYLLTPMMPRLEKLRHKFKTLIVLDFPLPNTKPSREVELHRDVLGQHWLYIYE